MVRLPKSKIKHFPGVSLALLLLALVIYFLGWSTLLSARSLQIDGTERTSEIRALLLDPSTKFHLGEPLARVDIHLLNRKLANQDWIENEKVGRDWLHGKIYVTVQERAPVGEFLDATGVRKLIDKTGSIFTNIGARKYPLISFASSDSSLLSAVALFIQELPPDLLANLSSISVHSSALIQSTHTQLGSGRVIINWGTSDEVVVKVKVLRALLALPENASVNFVDLSSPLAPIAK